LKALLFLVALLGFLHTSSCKDITVADAFIISLPDSAKERTHPQHGSFPDSILAKYYDASFQLFMYRWRNVNPSVPLNQIPKQWAKTKDWASISHVELGKSDSGIPYVKFNARMTRNERGPFDSVMTVFRSATDETFLLQMIGDTKSADAIRKSIQNK
jgi:hypothetical protein